MKYNEPIRVKGIGRDQLAFPTGAEFTEIMNEEIEFNSISQDSTKHESEAIAARMVGIAKSAATASASEAHKRAQNYPFEIVGITDFAMSGSGGIYSPIPFANSIVQNPNFYYDARDKNIYVNEAGWYFVRVFFSSTAISGNYDWGLRLISNVGGNNYAESYESLIDIRNSSKNANVSGSTIVNLPNQNESLNVAGRYGFKIELYTTATFASFLAGNTKASLQVFKLSNIFESDRQIYSTNI